MEPGPSSSGVPHRVSNGMSVVNGKNGGLETGQRVHPDRGNFEHWLNRDERLDDIQRGAHGRAFTNNSKHDLRGRPR
jgi:hypothetical protein